MSNKKLSYTPGPWTIEGNGMLAHPANGATVLTTRIGTDGWGEIELHDQTNEPDGNAQLIRSAPEMLDLIKDCREVVRYYNTKDRHAMLNGLLSRMDGILNLFE